METMTQQAKASNPWSKYGARPISELPLPTADDLEYEKDLEAYEQRQLRKLWKEERPEFKRLERLAYELGIKRVILTSESPSTILGRYLPAGDWESNLAEKWSLSERQENSILNSGPTILTCRDAAYEDGGACRFLAHEIGHHICRLAKFTPERLNAPVSKMMRRFFPDNAYLKKQNSQDEFHSECFAEYFTIFGLTRGIERECKAILTRVRRHNPDAANRVAQYRKMLLERARRTETSRG
jgi:hypothetical protein